MTKDRQAEIEHMTRDEQEALLLKLRGKYDLINPHPLKPGQPVPTHNAKELVADYEEMDFLEELLYPEEK